MKKNHLLSLGLIVLLAVACESPVDINILDDGPSLVVVSSFSDRSPIDVQVSVARPVLDTSFVPTVRLDASVQLFADGQYVDDLELILDPELEYPVYSSSLIPAPGINYSIEVDVPDFEVARANSTIPDPSPVQLLAIQDLEIADNAIPGLVTYLFTVFVAFPDQPGVQNFYHIKIHQNKYLFELNGADTIVTDTVRGVLQVNPVSNDNDQVSSFDSGLLLTDSGFDGRDGVRRFAGIWVAVNPQSEKLGHLVLELRTVSEEYFKYYSSLSRQQQRSQTPFSEPVILSNNIENGVGVFAGYASRLDSILLIP